jgi:hypothetical protein
MQTSQQFLRQAQFSRRCCWVSGRSSLGLDVRTRGSQEGTFNNCAKDSLSVQRISLSTTQINCIAIVINAHM